MSKGAKQRNSERRKNEKRSRKAAQQAKFMALADKEQNSKRFSQKNDGTKQNHMRPRSHPFGNCGNHGCKVCFKSINSVPERGTFQFAVLNLLYPNSIVEV